MNFQDIPIKRSIALDEKLRLHLSPVSFVQYQKASYSYLSGLLFALKLMAENNQDIDPFNDWFLVVDPEKAIVQGDYVLIYLQEERLAQKSLLFIFLSLNPEGDVCVKRIDNDEDVFLIPAHEIASMSAFHVVFQERLNDSAQRQVIDAHCFHTLATELVKNPITFYQSIESCNTRQTLRAAIYHLDRTCKHSIVLEDAALFHFFMQEKINDSALLRRFLASCQSVEEVRERCMRPLTNATLLLDKITQR